MNASGSQFKGNTQVGSTLLKTSAAKRIKTVVISDFQNKIASNYEEHRQSTFKRKGKTYNNYILLLFTNT